jgi:hypothetical protein
VRGLRRALLAALGPLVSGVSPDDTDRPYPPHITLTLGIDEAAAADLARAASAAGLAIAFRVDAVWLRAYRGQVVDAARSRRFRLAPR